MLWNKIFSSCHVHFRFFIGFQSQWSNNSTILQILYKQLTILKGLNKLHIPSRNQFFESMLKGNQSSTFFASRPWHQTILFLIQNMFFIVIFFWQTTTFIHLRSASFDGPHAPPEHLLLKGSRLASENCFFFCPELDYSECLKSDFRQFRF